MNDVVKANISERNGVDLLESPEEINVQNDLMAAAGVAFKGSSDYVIERVGGIIKTTIPDSSSKPIYTSDRLTAFEVFTTSTQTIANRRLRGDYTYTGDNLTSESYKIYAESDGTTILRTVTVTHTFDSNDFLTNSTVVET